MAEKPTYADLEQRVLELQEYQKRQATINILSLINKIDDVHDLIAQVALLVRNWSECEAVGIRMQENAHYPYVQTLGFPAYHIHSENHICVEDKNKETVGRSCLGYPSLKGMCGKVICGSFDPRLSVFTEYGSFITNSTSELWATHSQELEKCKICHTCHSEGYESVALIPLKNNTETFGLIQLNDSRKYAFSSQLRSLLEKVAFNLSLSLSKKKAAQQLRKNNEELTAIYENAPIIMMVVNKNLEVVKHNRYTNIYFNHANNDLRGRFLSEAINCWSFSITSENCCLYSNHVECEFANTIWDTLQNKKNYSNLESRIHINKSGNKSEQVFLLSSTYLEHEIEPQVLITMLDITDRKLFEEKLNEMSFHDSLTGLYNRNFFNEEMKRFQDGRYTPMSLVLCDIDGFKFINDTLGHHSGDELLANTGKVLQENFRSSDIVARIGGDEFAVIVPSTSKHEVERLIQRLKNSVQAYNDSDPRMPISLSIGYAVAEKRPLDMEKLFRDADDMMYQEKMQQEESTRNSTVKTFMQALEARDFIKQGHDDRLQKLVHSLASSLNLSKNMIHDLLLLVRFHDLGKVGIPDNILFKQGPLNEEEKQEIYKHSEIGQRLALAIPGLDPIAQWILQHHERWDGKGYPQGLKGKEIPLACRILAIADAYEAMTSDRPYRKAMSSEEAIAELRRCAGTQFDPRLVEYFVHIVRNSDHRASQHEPTTAQPLQ